MMVFASKLMKHASSASLTEESKSETSNHNDSFASLCNYNEDFSGHHLIWMQSSRRHLRPVHGNWGFIWPYGWYSCASTA